MDEISRALQRASVAALLGPRPCGKTTLARQIAGPDAHFFDLEQIVYVALLDDGSQVTLSPDAFAAKFGWQNDPNRAYLLGPTP